MQDKLILSDEEKARLMHNYHSKMWYRKNKEKAKASQIKSLARAYDRMIAEQAEAESAGAVDE